MPHAARPLAWPTRLASRAPAWRSSSDPEAAYRYTGKGNLVARRVSNGTAVLGLGDIGALAGKPVMEGKATLFKRFADIDVFDIEIEREDPDDDRPHRAALEPTFGGINLEDIKAPECFYIEETLRKRDERSRCSTTTSTARRSSPAPRCSTRSSSSASASTTSRSSSAAPARRASRAREMYVTLGVKRENVLLVDTVGVVYEGRTEKMNPYKAAVRAADDRARTLGRRDGGRRRVRRRLGGATSLTPDMLQVDGDAPDRASRWRTPIPEITYELAHRDAADVDHGDRALATTRTR